MKKIYKTKDIKVGQLWLNLAKETKKDELLICIRNDGKYIIWYNIRAEEQYWGEKINTINKDIKNNKLILLGE